MKAEIENATEQGWPVEALTERDGKVFVRLEDTDPESEEKPIVLEGVLTSWETPSPPDSLFIIAHVRLVKPST